MDALARSGFGPVGVCLTSDENAGDARPQADGFSPDPEPQDGLTGEDVEQVALHAPVILDEAFRELGSLIF
ncbi:MAG TPA: hypothetical protein VIJ15_12880 [Dermatophilaceae bacterium]